MHHSSKPEVWDQLAPDYIAQRAADPVYRSCLLQAIEALQPAGTVLDAGCGTGMSTRYLLHCEHVEALDFSGASLDTLQAHLGGRKNLEIVRADLRELPFPDASFDCVLCANTLQHLAPQAQPQAVAELLRVLKPRGRYAVSAHHYSRYKRRKRWIKEGRPGQPGMDYVFRFSRCELARLLPGAQIRAAGFYALPGRAQNLAARWLGKALVRLQIGHMLIAYGQKPH
jgi:SAM-dependent methyltransferase